MDKKYEPKDIYYPIINSELRYLVYGSVAHGYADTCYANTQGIAKSLVLKILNEHERNLVYCFFGSFPIDRLAQKAIKRIIKCLGAADRFHYVGNESEIVCLENGCSIRFFNIEKYDDSRIKSINGLKTAWVHVGDKTTREKIEKINPLFRNPESKIIFSFNTYVGDRFQEGWFYNDFLTELPDGSVYIM